MAKRLFILLHVVLVASLPTASSIAIAYQTDAGPGHSVTFTVKFHPQSSPSCDPPSYMSFYWFISYASSNLEDPDYGVDGYVGFIDDSDGEGYLSDGRPFSWRGYYDDLTGTFTLTVTYAYLSSGDHVVRWEVYGGGCTIPGYAVVVAG